MAQLGAAPVVDSARVPLVQFAQIQASRIAVIRRFAQHVCAAPGALHVLLAAVLLVCLQRCERNLDLRWPIGIAAKVRLPHTPRNGY
jgi:hypothetical protein